MSSEEQSREMTGWNQAAMHFSVLALAGLLFFFSSPHPARADSRAIYLQCLTNFEVYGESIWHTASGTGRPPDSGYWGDGGTTGNGGIRGNGGVAVAYAVLVLAQPGSPNNPTRLAHIRQALNYNAGTHASNTNGYTAVNGGKWGWDSGTDTLCGGATCSSSPDWQSAEWTGSMGLACLLMQSNLPAATVQACQSVVASEATHRAGLAPGSGYISDTIAEENAWDGNPLALAAAWMTNDANASLWLTAAKKYLANVYTVPDATGDPLASWITTTNVWPSWSIENHGFYYPIYEMVSGMSLGDSLLMARLANTNIAAQLQPFAEHNVMPVWTNNLQFMMTDTGDLAFPSGLDWELHDYEHDSYISWLAAHFNDPLARWADGQLAQLVLCRQNLNGNGTFVGPSGGGFYREAVEARRTAIAWLQWNGADYPSGPSNAPPPALVNFSDVGIIAQRGTNGFFSLSFGLEIMGYVEAAAVSPPGNAFVATPRRPGIIGLGALGNPTGAALISFATNSAGFTAELQIINGTNGTTELYVNSTGETIGMVEVPWPASNAVAGPGGSFVEGIENDPLTGGTRLLEWAGNSATVTNRSGASLNISNEWLCIAGHYGLAEGPAGHFNYVAPTTYNILGAAQDTLQFMPSNSLGPRYAVWFPAKSTLQTSNLASLISWTMSGTNAVLNFPGAGGSNQQISAVVAAPPAYPPYPAPISSVTASSQQSGFPASNAIDGNLGDYWVSAGTSPGQGPTTNNPEWLQFAFARTVGVSGFRVYPRTNNGGYGPKSVQMLLNGTPAYTGAMADATTLSVTLSPPIDATNAQLMIYSAYDPNYPTNSRNVQVMEVTFSERAVPGTFGDWELRNFSDAQLNDPATGYAMSDPDGDGAPNLLEFAMGGNPLVSDRTNFMLQSFSPGGNHVAIQFHERNQLGDVVRQFQSSADLFSWTNVTPVMMQTNQNLGAYSILQAVFSAPQGQTFFRINYTLGN